MAKWRDTASAECQADFDALLDVGIDVAAEQLTANWGLSPFAVVKDHVGENRLVAVPESGTDQYSASSTPLRDRLIAHLRSESDDLRSYAIISNVEAESVSGASLEFLLEHRDYAMQILLPYEMPDSETFNLGKMRAAVQPHLIWD